MRIDTALLCGAATARDGLLSILDGGVGQVERQGYPAPLALTLAMRVLVHPTEMARPHQLEVLLQDEDGEQITKVNIGVEMGDQSLVPPGEEASIAIPWNFPGQPMLPHAGRYSFEILIDGVHQVSVPLRAVVVEPQQQGGEQQ
jgi:hypothetical protein